MKSTGLRAVFFHIPVSATGNCAPWSRGRILSIAQSDSTHEYASAVFLKWLTQEEQNLDFAVNSGYLPVENSSPEPGICQGYGSPIPVRRNIIPR